MSHDVEEGACAMLRITQLTVGPLYRQPGMTGMSSVDLYQQLPPAGRAAAPLLEEMTNPRLASKIRLTGASAGVHVTSAQLQNWNHAPFAYRNPEGSYLLAPAFGVMEVAGNIEDA